GPGGDREIVLPGNRTFVVGDRIPRPDAGGGGGGSQAGHGDGDDAFVFSLSREEFMQVFFDDLELPNLARTTLGRAERPTSVRAEPVARAAMFCLMDVSASMDEEKKDLAKRFFTLLYLFLTRKYKEVDLVFIRHTDDAEEVDEDTFFHDPRTGGTIVLSALELAAAIHRERYLDGWNVYAAQASDGDAFGADSARSARYLREKVLPATRYY